MNDLGGKVAIVTGAARGIGAAIAQAMASAGAAVAVNYATSEESARRTVASIGESGGRAIAVRGDVSVVADAKRIVDETIAAFGAPDILVNNAAVFRFHPLEDVTEDDFHAHFDTNVLGTILMTQQAARYFRAGASVINVGSAGIRNPGGAVTLYAASKAAMDMVTAVLARELGPRQIRVNTLRPGATETEGNRLAGTMSDAGLVKALIGRTAMRRFGQPSDIGPAAVFLASDDAAWITGEILDVSGGYR